jgi:hypothetical protein
MGKFKNLTEDELRITRWRLLSFEPKTSGDIERNRRQLIKVSKMLYERTRNPIYLLGINGD